MSGVVATVVVPTYGRPRHAAACLRALATQTFREPWEVVVVDDGSPEPPDLGNVLQADGSRLRVVRQANAGPAAARNRGAAEADGEFIAFTDDDCRPHSLWLETLVAKARQRPGALVGGTTINGLPGELFASTSQMIVDFVYEHFNADRENAYFLASNNILCPSARFRELGGFDRTFSRAGAEDRDFCDRWRMMGWPIVWWPEARVEHRHSQSLCTFVDLCYRYGRGAYRYRMMRQERGSGTMREDIGFHKTLPRRVARILHERGVGGIAVVMALGLWQLANGIGFITEAAIGLGQRPSTR